jgi:hypothetical protein
MLAFVSWKMVIFPLTLMFLLVVAGIVVWFIRARRSLVPEDPRMKSTIRDVETLEDTFLWLTSRIENRRPLFTNDLEYIKALRKEEDGRVEIFLLASFGNHQKLSFSYRSDDWGMPDLYDERHIILYDHGYFHKEPLPLMEDYSWLYEDRVLLAKDS